MELFRHFKAQAILFDKDGTLIDFETMWGGWTLYLAEQIRLLSGLDVRAELCLALGYDEARQKTLPDGKLASAPMSELYQTAVEVARAKGVGKEAARKIIDEAWRIPDPALLARPLTNLRALFGSLRGAGIKIGIVTSDDRAPTVATLQAFDLEGFVSALVCGDDGVKAKPAPDMALTLCARLGVPPSKAMVVGDTVADLEMARAAGIGLVVGALSGVCSAKELSPHADLLLDSVESLIGYGQALEEEAKRGLANLNADAAFDL